MEGGRFKVGDEVTLVRPVGWTELAPRWMFWTRFRPSRIGGPEFGAVYVVRRIAWVPAEALPEPELNPEGLPFVGFADWPGQLFCAVRFRKVQRRSISTWLETSTEFEEPKRVPATPETVTA